MRIATNNGTGIMTRQTYASYLTANGVLLFLLLSLYSSTTLAANIDKNAFSSASNNIQAQWPTATSTLPDATTVSDKKKLQTTRFIIKYRAGLDRSAQAKLALQYSIQTIKQFKSLPNTRVVTIMANEPSLLLKKLKLDPNIEYVERDQVIQLRGMPNDAMFNESWSLNNSLDTDLNAPEAWDITKGNRDYVMAVIDTGVAYGHVDLHENMWINPNEIPNNGIDDDQNGYIDDIYGIDAGDMDTDPYDNVIGHGTHVAGIIAATGNNGIGISGINQDASILACKIFSENTNSLESFVSLAIECLDYVWDLKINHNVNIIASNASWGWTGKSSRALYDALVKHREAGILFVAAAGNSFVDNDNLLDFPSSYDLPNIISVAAQNIYNEQAFFTNYGAHTVHLSAPGENILSTVPGVSGQSTVTSDVFFDDMENGLANWLPDPEWGISANSFSGTVAWSDSPNGLYANNADTSLRSIVMDLSNYSGQALSLVFLANYQLEQSLDNLVVESSSDGGINWNMIGSLSGNSLGWKSSIFTIPANLVSSQFTFRFRLVTDSSITYDGIYIDDVGITSRNLIPIDDQYLYASGTSMAAPHVVGALGLLKSQDTSRDWRQLKNLAIAGGVPFNNNNKPTISNRRLRLVDTDGHGSLSCNNQLVQQRLRPTQDVIDIIDSNAAVFEISYLNINCAQPAGNITATIRDTAEQIQLLDDGQGIDQVAGDGIYSVRTNISNLNTSPIMVDFPNGDVLEVRLKPTYIAETPAFEAHTLNSPEVIEVPSDGFSVITPPFPLKFSGELHNIVYVYQDGLLGFALPRILGIPYFVNMQLPNRSYEAMVAPLWADLESDYGQIVSQSFGVPPNREFVVEWQNVNAYADTSQDGATFQVVFYENSSDIRINYKDVIFGDPTFNEGATATVGLQISSSLGVMHSNDSPAVTNQSSLLWKLVSSSMQDAGTPGSDTKSSSKHSGGFGGLFWMTVGLFGFYWRSRYQ